MSFPVAIIILMTLLTHRLGVAADYAADHHNLVTTAALQEAGLDRNQIRELCRDGVLVRVVRGLYRLRGTRTPVQDVAAALSRHTDAVASHTTALFVDGLDVEPPERPHLTLPPGSTSRTTLGILHRCPLDRVDVTRRHGLPVTTVARSVVDAGEQLSVRALAAVVNEAVSRKKTTIRFIEEAAVRAEAAPGRIGSGRVREVLSTWTDAIRPDSVAEAAAIRRICSFGLPAPVTQHRIVDDDGAFVARVDMAWPDEMVIREYDSARFHGPDRTEADEIRLQRLEALGWAVDSLHRRHLRPDSTRWLRQLRAELQGRRPSAAS